MYTQYDFIIVGAGIVGPALAKGLAEHGRSVLVLERDLSEPDRIVGELLQPGGVEALRKLGMESTLDGIDAAPIYGYEVIFNGTPLKLEYPTLEKSLNISTDTVTGKMAQGRGFHHGRFVMNLRKAAAKQKGVTLLQATVTDVVVNDVTGNVLGVKAMVDGVEKPFFASQTLVCDGTNSRFRKDYTPIKPKVQGYFVGTILDNVPLLEPNHGHVIIGAQHQPILVYQTSPTEARILCDVPAPLPSMANGDLKRYLEKNCLPFMPKQMQASFKDALDNKKLRSMPNQYLPATQNKTPGLIMLGDAMNMRHPLTGGGMTVGLNDAYLLSQLLGPKNVDLANNELVRKLTKEFYFERKGTSGVVNVLSVALYSLFAAKSSDLKILQDGCFNYFLCGGDCVKGPISLLSGLLPVPAVLFYHFFAVAFYAIYLNFKAKGIVGFPLALLQVFTVLYTAAAVFLPYLFKELL